MPLQVPPYQVSDVNTDKNAVMKLKMIYVSFHVKYRKHNEMTNNRIRIWIWYNRQILNYSKYAPKWYWVGHDSNGTKHFTWYKVDNADTEFSY